MLTLGFFVFAMPAASAETRTLKLYFVHTGERAEITFKRNGRYDQDGLKKLNRFLRDWRRNEPTKMDPRLFDIVWEAYKQSGSRDYIHVVSAYRSPATNSMLRSRSSGVAKKSQHMLGKAMDFYLPDVKLKNLRNVGLKLQAGGVGYYPRSGSPFVHLDVGNVRHWPKMSRSELVAVFPSGKTLHVPSDGKPLPGYEQAMASYKSRKNNGALAVASAGGGSSSGSGKGFLSAFFGGGADEEEESGGSVEVAAAEPAPKAVVAKAVAKKEEQKIRVMAPDQVERADVPVMEEAKETIVAALPERNAPLPGVAPRPLVDIGAPANPLVPLGAATPPTAPVAAEPVAKEAEIALNVPVPTWRPNHGVPAELAAPVVQVASAEDGVAAPLPSVRPAPENAREALQVIAAAPMPRPVETVDLVAALPSKAVPPSAGPFEIAPEEVIAAESKVAVMAYAAPELRSSGAKASSVRTTTKAARAKAKDVKKDARPVVVAAAPNEARWALNVDPLATAARPTKAPTFSYDAAVASTPTEVLTVGFQRDMPTADASRFTGKAVTFLSVAKFQTN